MEKQIIFLEPICTHNIWGGSKLRESFGYPVEGDDLGECWGISAHKNGDDTVKNGALAGKKLSEFTTFEPVLCSKSSLACSTVSL